MSGVRAPLPDSADFLTDFADSRPLAEFGIWALQSVRELEAENKELRRQNDNLREALAEAHRDLAALAVQIDDAEKELDLMAARAV